MICDPTLFPSKNSPNIAKSNHVFPGKMKGHRALILTYLDSLMVEIFPHHCLSFFDFGHLWEEMGGQSWSKIWVRLFSIKTQILQTFFKQWFYLLEYIFEQGPKNLQKGPFFRCWIGTQNLTLNLTTRNAILMKLTTIMCLHESVNQKPLRARNSVFWPNVYEFLDYIKNCHICHALPCIESLVKL